MTDKQFWQSKWKPFEILHVYIKDFDKYLDCILVSIDFEEKVMGLRPLDTEYYENEIFYTHISKLTRGKQSELKIKYINQSNK